MAADPIPEEVRRFIIQKIDSVAELEGLLILRREPDRAWTADSLAVELYVAVDQAEAVLARLFEGQLLGNVGAEDRIYRYAPDTDDLAGAVERTAEVYGRYLVPVTNLIHSKSQKRVQQFADAFKLKKETDK